MPIVENYLTEKNAASFIADKRIYYKFNSNRSVKYL